MCLTVLGDGVDHVMIADGRHRVNLQPANGIDLCGARFLLGFAEFFENCLAALQVACTGLGQRQAPGGAVDQPRLQPGLQARYGFGNVGCGGVQQLGRRREAAALGDCHEEPHALENIHRFHL
ncbi:hypothetical protein D3C76_1069550 [compost metagenome]